VISAFAHALAKRSSIEILEGGGFELGAWVEVGEVFLVVLGFEGPESVLTGKFTVPGVGSVIVALLGSGLIASGMFATGTFARPPPTMAATFAA
jgi:hypothetical protein